MRRNIRLRISLGASVLVAVLLVASGLVLLALQRGNLVDGIDRALQQRTEDIELLIAGDVLPPSLPATGTEGFVTVVDPSGTTLASSPGGGDGAGPTLGPGLHEISLGDDTYRVLVSVVDGATTITVGESMEAVEEAGYALFGSLAVIIPVVLIVAVGMIWWMVGRTLRPVEDLRSEVAVIGSTDLDRRVAVPQTHDEIQRLAETMNAMLNRLETSVGRQQRFVADVSHELRSPLTRLRAGIETTMRLEGVTEPLAGFLDDVIGMQDLVEDMLYLARSDAGKLAPHPELVDLDDLVLDEANAVSGGGRRLVDVTGVEAVQVWGDPRHLRRAIKNVTANAVRHAETKVAFRLSSEGDHAVFQVEDDGSGVPATEAESVFERFTRLDDARSSDRGGSGLGLAIAREVVENHAGSVRIANPGTPGAIFEITIPTIDSN